MEQLGNSNISNRVKIAFFVKKGLDSFLEDIISFFSAEYEVKKVVVNNLKKIDEEMRWADICWFEWCDELIDYGSKLEIAKTKKIICRIHGYEVYGDLIKTPKWENIDQVIIVAPHIKRIFEENIKHIYKDNLKIDLVYCGLDIDKYEIPESMVYHF
jgi:glycosyltransferase involved in cell wall biosynthesis